MCDPSLGSSSFSPRRHGCNTCNLVGKSLGTDLRMWDAVVAVLPGWHHIRFAAPGHGLSATPLTDWHVTDLADDAATLLDHVGIDRAVIGGCSMGGMISQAMAIRHPHRVRGLILSNPAAKIGTADAWVARMDAVRQGGLGAISTAVLDRWFPLPFRHNLASQRQRVISS